jgi:hypothetical protein
MIDGTIRDAFGPCFGSESGGIMNTSSSLNSRAWRGLYKAALFEVDNARLPDRIAQAEEALGLRARELFHVAGDNIEEGEALDDAMYALHALQNTLQANHRMPHRREAS